MNQAENVVRSWLVHAGASVCRSGWPDFLVKIDGDLYGVEVKAGSDHVRDHQAVVHALLAEKGIHVAVFYVAHPNAASVEESVLVPWNPAAEILLHRLKVKLGIPSDDPRSRLAEDRVALLSANEREEYEIVRRFLLPEAEGGNPVAWLAWATGFSANEHDDVALLERASAGALLRNAFGAARD